MFDKLKSATKSHDSQSHDQNPPTNHTQSNHDEPPPPSYSQAVGANIALNTDFISEHPLNLTMKGEPFSTDFEVTDAHGQTMLTIDSSMFSMSHEMTLTHAPSGHNLFTIRKKQFSMSWRYSAELPPEGSGHILFETETSPSFLSSGTTLMRFRNAVTQQMDDLEVELHTYSGPSQVKYRGKVIADIDREMFSIGSNWRLDIHVPGVDPLLIVVLALVIADRIRTKNRRNR